MRAGGRRGERTRAGEDAERVAKRLPGAGWAGGGRTAIEETLSLRQHNARARSGWPAYASVNYILTANMRLYVSGHQRRRDQARAGLE